MQNADISLPFPQEMPDPGCAAVNSFPILSISHTTEGGRESGRESGWDSREMEDG